MRRIAACLLVSVLLTVATAVLLAASETAHGGTTYETSTQ